MRFPERRSKIVCTIGPAVASYENIRKLIEVGMDVARINFSHGSHESHGQVIDWIREASRELGVPVAILGDLQGPKIRTGKLLQKPHSITSEQLVHFKGIEVGQVSQPADGSASNPITISYPRLATDLRRGDKLLFDDGLIRMTVDEVLSEQGIVRAKVEHGKELGENKGVNMPGAKLSTSGITEKDWDDILFAAKKDLDFLALSFVRTPRELKSLKGFLEQKGLSTQVVAKIEMMEAVENIDDIIMHTDAIMVARGDLGVEIGNEKVPLVQKRVIQKARAASKPVITATQMLMSMVDSPSPTRAEASDVANAVLDGSDALMLSNETATGKFPFKAVQTMSSIIRGAETIHARDFANTGLVAQLSTGKQLPVSEAIETAATTLAESLRAACMACLTRSGRSARLLAKHRAPIPIFAFAESEKVRNQLCLSWGVSVVAWKEVKAQDYTIFDDLTNALGRLGILKDGDLSVMTAGIPTTQQIGTTNTIVVRSYPPPRREGF